MAEAGRRTDRGPSGRTGDGIDLSWRSLTPGVNTLFPNVNALIEVYRRRVGEYQVKHEWELVALKSVGRLVSLGLDLNNCNPTIQCI